MSMKPGDAYVKEFTTATPSTGAAADADSLPVATANHNGTDDAAFVLTVTKIDTGRYKITGTVPAYSAGDTVNVTVAATCGGVAGKAAVDRFDVDTLRVSGVTAAVVAAMATAPVGSVAAGVTVSTNNDKTGYSLTVAPPTASAIAALILANPAHLLATDSSGNVSLAQAFPPNFANFAITVGGAVTAGTIADKTGYALSAAGLDQVPVETGVNARQALSPILAAAAGKLSGAGTGTVTIFAGGNGNSSTTRITATTDASFNRTSVTLVLPA